MTDTTGDKRDSAAPSNGALDSAARKARALSERAAAAAGPALARAAAKAKKASASLAAGTKSLAREVSADIRTGVSAVRADLASRAEKKRALAEQREKAALAAAEMNAAEVKKAVVYPDAAVSPPADLAPRPLAGEGNPAAPLIAPPPIAPPAAPPLTSPAPEKKYRPIGSGEATLRTGKPLADGTVKAEPPMTAQPGVLRATASAPPGAQPKSPRARAKAAGGSNGGGGNRRNAFADLFLLATSLGFVGAIGALFVGFVLLAPRVEDGADLWAVNRLPSVIVLDRNGEELAARGSRYGQAVGVADLPPYLVSAILATEDRRFYEHMGVDLRGMARALLANFRSGEVVEGGSTITQQLARNLFLTPRQTYTRKAKEALLAFWIEGRYTKDQILSLYLNRIYLGAGAYGVEQAARTYFGKSARDVTLSEAVMLAGLPKAPSQLAPTMNPLGAQERANAVLENLRETGAITEFEAREALSHPPQISDGGSEAELGYFFDYIAAEARARAKGREGDLTVTTTLDKNLQRQAVAAVKAVIGVDAKLSGAEQAALIAYDVNGALLAMVGGTSYVESQFNRATQAKRQPGSAFKPFVYAAALEAGLTPNAIFVDQPVDIDGWKPSNYTPGFQGRMRLTDAVAKSVNTIAVQVAESIGREHVVELAKRFGIKSDLPAVPSIALGGVSVSLEELTGAYVPFANGGFAAQPYAIERIEDQNLEVVYQRRARNAERVMDPQVSEGMNHLLFQVMHSGTGAGAALGSRVSAGKTGTTNDWRDAWFVGYTAQIVAGVWVGNDDFTPMDRVTGGAIPAKIWHNFMIAAHQDLPNLPIKGAYPATSYGDEDTLISFYTDVLRGFQRVKRDGRRNR